MAVGAPWDQTIVQKGHLSRGERLEWKQMGWVSAQTAAGFLVLGRANLGHSLVGVDTVLRDLCLLTTWKVQVGWAADECRGLSWRRETPQ